MTDILNKSEIDIVQTFNNYTLRRDSVESASVDVSLDTAGNTLLNMQSRVKMPKEALAKEQIATLRTYFKEITSGTLSLLIIAIIIILVLIRKRLRCVCINHKGSQDRKSIDKNETIDSSEINFQPEALEMSQMSTTQNAVAASEKVNQKLYPKLHIAEEVPLRI